MRSHNPISTYVATTPAPSMFIATAKPKAAAVAQPLPLWFTIPLAIAVGFVVMLAILRII